LESSGERTRISNCDGSILSAEDPFVLLEQALQKYLPEPRVISSEWPFTGGAIGCFGYGLGRRGARLLQPSHAAMLADMRVGIYQWALLQDHDRRQCAVVFSDAIAAAQRQMLLALLCSADSSPGMPFRLESAFVSNMDRESYAAAFERVQRYILAGDCYQVNLAQRLSAACSGDPWQAYLHLRRRMASPYSAYLQSAGSAILSFSPERFLHVADGRVETRPIKGTARRLSNAEADLQQASRLLASEKDRAENIMIVDLMRNDLGKSCRTGSVRVEKLCGLESYANVHHLVSVVTGQLRAGRGPFRLLSDCFPGGSITGAPKIRAMQIIEQLEPDPREIYCGSIGYVSAHGIMDTSIAIRTLVCHGGQIHAWGGGGIVADSDCETEYRESLTKIEPLLNGLLECNASGPLRDRAGSRS
jgi:para-aminobenzoate synthetase component I